MTAKRHHTGDSESGSFEDECSEQVRPPDLGVACILVDSDQHEGNCPVVNALRSIAGSSAGVRGLHIAGSGPTSLALACAPIAYAARSSLRTLA